MTILEDKVISMGGTFTHVNTFTFKASQYDHTTGACVKKELKERWHHFADGTKIQRDLYSAFLLMNAMEDGKEPNRMKCNETFAPFKPIHDLEIERIAQHPMMILNSGIRLKNNKTASTVL